MAYYNTINLVQGDTLPQLEIQLRDSNKAAAGTTLDPTEPTTWDPIDITSAQVFVKLRQVGSTTVIATIQCGRIAPYVEGNVYMDWGSNLSSLSGDYEGEIYIEYTAGGVQTVYDKLKFNIRDDF